MCRRAAAGLSSPNLVDSHLLVASTRALSDMLMLTASATIFGSAAPLAPCPTFDAGGLSVSTKGDATVIYPSQTGEDVQACVDKHSCIGTVTRECPDNSGNCGQIFRERSAARARTRGATLTRTPTSPSPTPVSSRRPSTSTSCASSTASAVARVASTAPRSASARPRRSTNAWNRSRP